MQKDPLEKYETHAVGPARLRIKSLSKLPKQKLPVAKIIIHLAVAAILLVALWLIIK